MQQPINPCANIYTILYTNTQTYTHMYRQTHPQQCSIWWSFTDVLVGESEILCPVQNDGWTDANRNKPFFSLNPSFLASFSSSSFFLPQFPTSISCLFPPSFLHCIFSSFISSHVSLRSSFLIPSYWSFVLPIFHHSWAAALGGGLSPVEYRMNQWHVALLGLREKRNVEWRNISERVLSHWIRVALDGQQHPDACILFFLPLLHNFFSPNSFLSHN